jgi:hypothetical protein
LIDKLTLYSHTDFRFWLAEDPIDRFLVNFPQNATKIFSEPPSGL